jgi:NDP-sugar pyrophosphorylase family protein
MKRPNTAVRYKSREILLPASIDVLLLAGGKGTRLRSSLDPELSCNPKLLVSIDSDGRHEPMLDTVIRRLSCHGFTKISLLTCGDEAACGEAIECHAAVEFGPLLSLRVFREDYPLGTAGTVYAALNQLDSPCVIVVPGDTLFPFAKLTPGLVRHASYDAAITSGLSRRNQERQLRTKADW